MSWDVDPPTKNLQIRFTGQANENQFWLVLKLHDLSNEFGITNPIGRIMEWTKVCAAVHTTYYPVDLPGAAGQYFYIGTCFKMNF